MQTAKGWFSIGGSSQLGEQAHWASYWHFESLAWDFSLWLKLYLDNIFIVDIITWYFWCKDVLFSYLASLLILRETKLEDSLCSFRSGTDSPLLNLRGYNYVSKWSQALDCNPTVAAGNSVDTENPRSWWSGRALWVRELVVMTLRWLLRWDLAIAMFLGRDVYTTWEQRVSWPISFHSPMWF